MTADDCERIRNIYFRYPGFDSDLNNLDVERMNFDLLNRDHILMVAIVLARMGEFEDSMRICELAYRKYGNLAVFFRCYADSKRIDMRKSTKFIKRSADLGHIYSKHAVFYRRTENSLLGKLLFQFKKIVLIFEVVFILIFCGMGDERIENRIMLNGPDIT